MDSVEFYPMIALLLFGTFFIGWLVYTIMMPKSDADHFSQIPFEQTDLNEKNHE